MASDVRVTASVKASTSDSTYDTHLKGSAYHATNAILLQNAIREDHTDVSGKLFKSQTDSSGVTLVCKPAEKSAHLDKQPLYLLYLLIDHPVSTKTQMKVELV